MHRRLLFLPLAAVLALGTAGCGTAASPVAPDDSTVLRSGVYGGSSTMTDEDDGEEGDPNRGGTYGGSST
jgi:hypothetical protein